LIVVVSDTSPLRVLQRLNQLDLLPALFDEVLVPPTVVVEIANVADSTRRFDVAAVPGVRVVAPASRSPVEEMIKVNRLDPGEAEAIQLAVETRADVLLIDERRGTKIARECGLRTTGVLGILVQAKQRQLIQSVRPFLSALQNEGRFFLTEELIEQILRLAGEA
jgi:predicted nucleic acid-binding protein